MRIFSGLLISTLALGTIVTTGCAEHRSQAYGPYYGSYNGWNAGEDPYYRQWLAERRYNYVEYSRLNHERQREYWEWRHQNDARFRQDQRFRDNQRIVRNDHDRDDRRDRDYARTRNGDKDRHRGDRDRHQARNRDHDKDRDHDRNRDRR